MCVTRAIACLLAFAAAGAAQRRQFELDVPAAFLPHGFQRMVTADVDGDGDLDVFGSAILWLQSAVVLLRNDGNGVFTDVTATHVPALPHGAFVTMPFDVDGDLLPDLFVGMVNWSSVVLRNVGGGRYVVHQTLAFAPSVVGAAAADLDGDGDLDVAAAGSFLYGSMDTVLVNSGGVLAPGPVIGSTIGAGVAAVDVDLDGDLDLVRAATPLRILRNDGNLVFTDVTATQVAIPQIASSGAFVVGDLDGDGDADVVLQGPGNGVDVVVENQGGTLVGVALLPPHPPTMWTALGDVDRDGVLDVLRAHQSGPLTLARGGGGLSFVDAPARLPSQAIASQHVHLADLDRDGDPEVLSSMFAATPLVLRNRDIDLVVGPAGIGQPWQLEVGSQPGYATQSHACRLGIGLAALPQPLRLPGFGELWLDPTGPVLLLDGVVVPAVGAASWALTVPNAPALSGLTLHVQGLAEPAPYPARLTAYVPVTLQ